MCRICLEEDSVNNLIYPCKCSGGSKYIHKECLNEWRTISENRDNMDRCECCHYEYKFGFAFLGLGFPSDFPTWGRLLYDAKDFITLTPARALWPGLAISLTVLSVNYMGDGLRDALDPRARGR